MQVNPETGISKGYGFVRFTDEADQQRALIEMQGLYCLSRPSECATCPIWTATNLSSAPLPCHGQVKAPVHSHL